MSTIRILRPPATPSRPVQFVPVLLLVLLVLGGPLQAQVVRGRVLDAETQRPLANSVVRLLAMSGEVRRVAAADSAGRFELPVGEPGTYRVRAEQLGYESGDGETIEVRDGTSELSVELRLRPAPIPIAGVEVSTDQVNRRLRQFLGQSPGQLRIRPVRRPTIEDHASRGNDVTEMMGWVQVPNLEVIRSRDGPCYRFRGRGCLPVYLDGAPLNRTMISTVPLQMLNTVVVLLPSEAIAYPNGAVHLFSTGFMR